MSRLYSYENFPIPVVDELRSRGHDVLTIQEQGRGNEAVPDNDVLAFAIEDERAVLTLNRRNFIRLHNENSDHFGIIVCTVDPDFDAQIDEELQQTEDLRGRLIRINRP